MYFLQKEATSLWHFRPTYRTGHLSLTTIFSRKIVCIPLQLAGAEASAGRDPSKTSG